MLRYDRQIKPGLVALYDIRSGNGAGPFLQPRSPHGAFNVVQFLVTTARTWPLQSVTFLVHGSSSLAINDLGGGLHELNLMVNFLVNPPYNTANSGARSRV